MSPIVESKEPQPEATRPAGTFVRRAVGILSVAMIATMVVLFTGLAVGYRPVVIQTGSMGETAPAGSLIIAAPPPANQVVVPVEAAQGNVLLVKQQAHNVVAGHFGKLVAEETLALHQKHQVAVRVVVGDGHQRQLAHAGRVQGGGR